jgi:cytochrome c551/c552
MRLSARNILITLAVLFIVIQFVPVSRTNPPADPAAAFRATRPSGDRAAAVLDRSCGDCHSNATVWPWYSHVAPVSWLLYRDVSEGRRHLNLSDFRNYDDARQERRLMEICEQAKSGDMPPWFYLPMHPNAKLQPGDVEALCSLTRKSAAN